MVVKVTTRLITSPAQTTLAKCLPSAAQSLISLLLCHQKGFVQMLGLLNAYWISDVSILVNDS